MTTQQTTTDLADSAAPAIDRDRTTTVQAPKPALAGTDGSAAPSHPAWRTSTISAATLATLLVLWAIVTGLGLIEPLFLPSPWEVGQRLVALTTEGYVDATLGQHLGASLQRIALALIGAIAFAIPVGIAIGRSRIAQGIFDPLIEFYRPVPPLAYLPLIVIWFGIGELSKVLLIYLAIFAPVAIATANGVRNVDPSRIRAAQFLATDVVVAGILVIAIVAFALELGLRWLQRRLVPWHGQSH